MAGQIHALVERIVVERSKGNRFNAQSADDPAMLARVRQVAAELNVSI